MSHVHCCDEVDPEQVCPDPSAHAHSAGAAPLDVERLAEALVLVTREVLFRGDRDAANWRHKTAENLVAEYARLSEGTDR